MPSSNAVWGIDIGQCALKALKLRPAGDGKVEAVAFDVIEHPKILSQPDADRDELISSAMEKFASRNDWQGDKFIIGVPGQQTFARFCKMPPIDLKKDAKKIPQLVQYEASQQIPFDMDDVVWDYQIFTCEGSPDIEVGIFAIRKDLIRKHMGFFSAVGIAPVGVQTVPASLYNFCHFDGRVPDTGSATVIVDVGAQNTDLIIVEPNAAWTRNIPLGGNSFTEALVRSFKLSFAKAESLKRTAATSKYARQIFQAMRPIFAELVAEIQRSIGFYSSTHRDVELKRVVALGNAFRLPGLQKYLENNLTISGGVVKLEKFNNIVPTATTSAPQFTDNILSFAAAYGLALQGLNLAKIRASLLPTELARIAAWQKKRPYFVASAAALLIAAGVPFAANALDQQALDAGEQTSTQTEQILREARGYVNRYNEAHKDTGQKDQDIQKLFELRKDKRVLPELIALVNEALPPVYPPELAQIATAKQLKEAIESNPTYFDRTKRGQLLIESFDVMYQTDVTKVTLGAPASSTPGTPNGGAPGFGPGGGRGFGPPGFGGPPGGGRGFRGGPPGYPGGPGYGYGGPTGGGDTGETEESTENAGFIVKVKGRLLYGTAQSQASMWLNDNYFARLREMSHQKGLGFFIPDDEESKRSIEVDQLTSYNKLGTGFQPGQGFPGRPGGFGPGGVPPTGGEAGASDVEYPDPVTGEETKNDWLVEFTFKVKLGEAPAKEATAEGDGNQASVGTPGGQARP